MHYGALTRGIFLERLNRFAARVWVEDPDFGHLEPHSSTLSKCERGGEFLVHVRNTGRCGELLVPGSAVWLLKSDNPARRTSGDLIAVERGDGRLVNLDSLAPNRAAAEWLAAGGMGELASLRAEVREGDSRFDFRAESGGRPFFIEVKGCTLEEDGVARFPDAPTLRGLKHVRELTKLARVGNRCAVLIVIQMKGARIFQPNWAAQPKFGEALIAAREAGVEIVAVDCLVRPGEVRIDRRVAVDLTRPNIKETISK